MTITSTALRLKRSVFAFFVRGVSGANEEDADNKYDKAPYSVRWSRVVAVLLLCALIVVGIVRVRTSWTPQPRYYVSDAARGYQVRVQPPMRRKQFSAMVNDMLGNRSKSVWGGRGPTQLYPPTRAMSPRKRKRYNKLALHKRFFDLVLVVNAPERVDKWWRAHKKMRKLGLRAERFVATLPSSGHIMFRHTWLQYVDKFPSAGLRARHLTTPLQMANLVTLYNVILQGHFRGARSVLAVLDDARPLLKFESTFNTVIEGIRKEQERASLEDVQWKVIMLGAEKHTITDQGKRFRTAGMHTAFAEAVESEPTFVRGLPQWTSIPVAVAIHHTAYDELLELIGSFIEARRTMPEGGVFDKLCRRTKQCYSILPSLFILPVEHHELLRPRGREGLVAGDVAPVDEVVQLDRRELILQSGIVGTVEDRRAARREERERQRAKWNADKYDVEVPSSQPHTHSVMYVPPEYRDYMKLAKKIRHTSSGRSGWYETAFVPPPSPSTMAETPYGLPPLVTVMMTAYNANITVEMALHSLFQQTYPNMEIVVVDDKSDVETRDELRRILANIGKRNVAVKLILNAERRGTYPTRNVALQYAQGQILAWQDADDYSLPTRIEKQVAPILEGDAAMTMAAFFRTHLAQLPWRQGADVVMAKVRASRQHWALTTAFSHVMGDFVLKRELYQVPTEVEELKKLISDKLDKFYTERPGRKKAMYKYCCRSKIAFVNMVVARSTFYQVGVFSNTPMGGDAEWIERYLALCRGWLFANGESAHTFLDMLYHHIPGVFRRVPDVLLLALDKRSGLSRRLPVTGDQRAVWREFYRKRLQSWYPDAIVGAPNYDHPHVVLEDNWYDARAHILFSPSQRRVMTDTKTSAMIVRLQGWQRLVHWVAHLSQLKRAEIQAANAARRAGVALPPPPASSSSSDDGDERTSENKKKKKKTTKKKKKTKTNNKKNATAVDEDKEKSVATKEKNNKTKKQTKKNQKSNNSNNKASGISKKKDKNLKTKKKKKRKKNGKTKNKRQTGAKRKTTRRLRRLKKLVRRKNRRGRRRNTRRRN